MTLSQSETGWFPLDKNGFLVDSPQTLKNQAAIYIYQSLVDELKIYIGSTINLSQRFRQHRNRVKNGSIICPIFYNSVRKNGWNNFQFAILEYIDLELYKETEKKKEIIRARGPLGAAGTYFI